MPWPDHRDALKFTKKATTPELQKLWQQEANRTLAETGDEGKAVQAGNSAVKHHHTGMYFVRALAHRRPK